MNQNTWNSIMEEKTYNGWSNYETWNAKLWLDNDEGIYRYIIEMATSDFIDKEPYEFGDFIKGYVEELQDQEKQADFGLFTDLLNSALQEVNWTEIAESYLEEIREEEEEND